MLGSRDQKYASRAFFDKFKDLFFFFLIRTNILNVLIFLIIICKVIYFILAIQLFTQYKFKQI